MKPEASTAKASSWTGSDWAADTAQSSQGSWHGEKKHFEAWDPWDNCNLADWKKNKGWEKGWVKWQGPAPETKADAPAHEKWFDKGQQWRSGKDGGDQRYGNPGGQCREYYKAFKRVQKLGKRMEKTFLEEYGHPKAGNYTAERKAKLRKAFGV